MIFVTLGTHDKPFTRLLKKIDEEIIKGNIKEKVIVQAGFTKYKSDNMEIFDLVPMDTFEEYMKKADLIITHGGVGSIMSSLKLNKKVIAVARLCKYHEVVNDHQIQIIENFDDAGYIIGVTDMNDLDKALKKVKNFKPKKYKSNTNNMIKLVSSLIDKD